MLPSSVDDLLAVNDLVVTVDKHVIAQPRAAALEFVELWNRRRKAAAKISSGMQRRLQLAAAIVHGPELLFVDEPTANLDPVLRRKFWDEFKALRDQGRAIFVTTQYVGKPRRATVSGFSLGASSPQ